MSAPVPLVTPDTPSQTASGERSATAGSPSSSSDSLGLSVLGTSPTLSPHSREFSGKSRLLCMRRGVLFTARAIEEALVETGQRMRKAFITLTYRPGVRWAPEHVSQTISCYAEWARRRGFPLLYVWVLELTQAGVPHYHLLLWMPVGFTPPLPDQQGWWKHGMTQAKWVRSPLGYLAKYLSKESLSGHALPKGARILGSGGLTAGQRLRRVWYCAPAWLKRFAPADEVCKVRRCDGGWWNMTTGFWYRSPWWVTVAVAKACQLFRNHVTTLYRIISLWEHGKSCHSAPRLAQGQGAAICGYRAPKSRRYEATEPTDEI